MYGFNPSLDTEFGARVFVFPLPGTPCNTTTADSVMRELALVLSQKNPEQAPFEHLGRAPAAVTVRSMAEKTVGAPRFQSNRGSRDKGCHSRPTRDVAKLILCRFKAQGWS